MRVVTYNFLAGGGAKRSAHWDLLRERLAPDLVLAQECRPPARHPKGAGLFAPAAARGWGSGLYISSGKVNPIAVRGHRGWVTGGELPGRAWLSKKPLRAFSIHCPHGAGGYVKSLDAILDALLPFAEGADLLLGGDFNVAAGLRPPGDRIKLSSGERRLLERLAGEFGLMPCWQALHPGLPLAQTLRWSGNRALPYHCDGIFAPAAWRPRLVSCEVQSGPEWDLLSDHNPVLAVFA